MGIDFEKLNKARQQIEERLNKSNRETPSFRFWKPKSGKNTIRICPPWINEGPFSGEFWREVAQHWNVSEDYSGPILCTKKTPRLEGDCPICEFVDELRGMKNDVAAMQLAKDLKSKSAFFLNIVDLDDPVFTAKDVAEEKQAKPDAEVPFAAGDLKIQVFAAGPMIFNQIIASIAENEIDVTNPESGHNFTIKKTGSGVQNTKYEVTMIVKPSVLEGFNDNTKVPELDKVGFVMERSKILEIMSKGKAGEFNATLASANEAPKLSAYTEHLDEDSSSEESSSEDESDDLTARLRAAIAKG